MKREGKRRKEKKREDNRREEKKRDERRIEGKRRKVVLKENVFSNRILIFAFFSVGVPTNVWIPLIIKPGMQSGSVKGSVHLQVYSFALFLLFLLLFSFLVCASLKCLIDYSGRFRNRSKYS